MSENGAWRFGCRKLAVEWLIVGTVFWQCLDGVRGGRIRGWDRFQAATDFFVCGVS